MLLNLLVLYTFIIALFKKIDNFATHPHYATTTLSPNMSTTPFDNSADNFTFTTEMDLVSFSTNNSIENGIVDAIGTLIQGTAAAIGETVPELTSMFSTNVTYCYQVAVNCSKSSQFNRTMVTSLFFLNFTTTILPELLPHLNVTNDFSMSSSSSSSTIAYTDETFDWMDFNATSTDYDYYNGSSTTETGSTFDFFNYSTTDMYDMTAMGENTTNADTNPSYPEYGMETTMPTTPDEYDYDYDGSNQRRRRKRSNETLNDYLDYNYGEDDEDSVEKSATTIDDMTTSSNDTLTTITFDDYTFSNASSDDYNHTEFISSTIASFVDNITTTEWPNEMNTTYVSELWTEYLTTLNSTFTDEYDVDDPDEICYETRCDVIEKSDEDDETTPPTPSTTLTSTQATTTTTTPMSTIQLPMPIVPTCPPLTLSTAISDLLPTTVSTGNETRYGNLSGFADQRKYCWETMFGQELVKLTVLDLVRLHQIRIVHIFFQRISFIFRSSQLFRRSLWTFSAPYSYVSWTNAGAGTWKRNSRNTATSKLPKIFCIWLTTKVTFGWACSFHPVWPFWI